MFLPHGLLSSLPVTLLSILHRFELFIPIVMTSSGAWRCRLHCPSCLQKGFATSRNNKERCHRPSLVKSFDRRVHTEPSAQMKRTAHFRAKVFLLAQQWRMGAKSLSGSNLLWKPPLMDGCEMRHLHKNGKSTDTHSAVRWKSTSVTLIYFRNDREAKFRCRQILGGKKVVKWARK